jgi:predicted nuclease with TOPRIM domain
MDKFSVKVKEDINLDLFFETLDKKMQERANSKENFFSELIHEISDLHGKIKDLTNNYDEMQQKIDDLSLELDLLKIMTERLPDDYKYILMF